MFKLESYITPLLLGYVDKYIKNLKSDDFQLSLWGGDAVFTNLDLRLDVIEDEFHLPFTFTNGHIHELRIHVPWTKLGSEPIVITIETIECVLTLKGESDDTNGSQKSKQDLARRRMRKGEVQEAPPGYVQSFIGRIANNISIVFNNLIFKYVEDDIVLSLNIKSAEMYNVNNSWERAFTDLSPQNPALRRVINMHDLTMCLDKRNASGIIEVYQDPLLFRCSAWCRLHMDYDNPHSKIATATHVSVYCEQLDFSITDQQLPMFFRLMQLCLALFNGDIMSQNKAIDRIQSKDDQSEFENYDSNPAGWGSWAWSYVPQILPLWDEASEEEQEDYQRQRSLHIFQFRFLIGRTSLVFKLSENVQSSKLAFRSIALLRQYGTSLNLILQGSRFVNVQLGVTAAEVTNMDSCVCGGCRPQENDKVYFQSGVMPGDGHTYSFLTASLFDPLSPENCTSGSQEVIVDWDEHLNYLTQAVMNERYPCFAFDFLYDLEIPTDWSDKASEITATFLENSNWHEHSLCRIVIGKSCLNVTSSFVHLIRHIIDHGTDHEYAPYCNGQPVISTSKNKQPTEDDVLSLQTFVPVREYHILWHQPLVRIQMADHTRSTVSKERQLKKQRNQKNMKDAVAPVMGVPLLLSAGLIDVQTSDAMYPYRMNSITSSLPEPPPELLQYCYTHAHVKIFQLEVMLHSKPQMPILLVPPFSLAGYSKTQNYPQFWDTKPFNMSEKILEIDNWSAVITKSQLIYLGCLGLSWFRDAPLTAILSSSLKSDISNSNHFQLSIDACSFYIRNIETLRSRSYQGSLSSITVSLNLKETKRILLSAPSDTSSISNSGYFRDEDSKASLENPKEFFSFTIQLPKNAAEISCEAAVVSVRTQGFMINFDPLITSWLTVSLHETSILTPTTEEPVLPSVSSAASSHSKDISSSYSLGRSMSAATLSAQKQTHSELKTLSSRIVSCYRILKKAVVHIDFYNGFVLWPTESWCQSEGISLLENWKDIWKSGKVVPALALCLPRLTIMSHGDQIKEMDIPLIFPIADESFKFPWKITFTGFSAYTMQPGTKGCHYLVKPTNASLTLAITDTVSQLAFCIHLDMDSLYFSASKEQVLIATTIVDLALSWVNQMLNTSQWLLKIIQHSAGFFNAQTLTYQLESGARNEEPASPLSEYASAIDVCCPSAVKLTLWLQCTLPKLGISMLNSSNNKEAVWLQLEAEELTASLDIQEVFIKGKSKVSLFNISSFQKSPDENDWHPGFFEGIILCGSDKLTRNLTIPTHLLDQNRQSALDKSSSFLSVTFTRVLGTSVGQYWAKKLKDLPLDGSSGIAEGEMVEQPKYISEFDIKVDPFDIVLWLPLLSSVVDILLPLQTLINNPLVTFLSSNVNSTPKQSLTWNLNVQNLPLVYLHMGGLRCFLPSTTSGSTLGDTTKNVFDVCLIQTGKVVLVPQADNLLSRIVVNDTLYSTAVLTGNLHIPGSPIEDRQYQLDLFAVSLTSVLWQDMRERSNVSCMVPCSNLTTLGQNPAVEWNNRVESVEEEDEAVVLQPIITSFDLRLVAAPAIICASKASATQGILVCGHSLELNAVTNVDIYLSFQQISLLLDVVNENLINGTSQLVQYIQELSGFNSSPPKSIPKDSGIESEVADVMLVSILTDSFVTDNEISTQHVPTEILLTANSVAMTLFLQDQDLKQKMMKSACPKRKLHRRSKPIHKPEQLSPLQEDRFITNKRKKNNRTSKKNVKQDPLSNESSPERIIISPSNIQRKPKALVGLDSSEEGYEGSNDSSSSSQHPRRSHSLDANAITNLNNVKIHPFLYIVLSQPHTFISCQDSSEKLQLSCFDLSIKSGRHNFFIDALGPAYCPLPSHFTIPWLETKPGETNPKTGIPPPLLTVTVKDFLTKPGGVSLSFERPTLLHLSMTRFDQANAVVQSLLQVFFSSKTEPTTPTSAVAPLDQIKSFLSFMSSITLSTVQISLMVEGPPSLPDHQLSISVSNIASMTKLDLCNNVETLTGDICVNDFQLYVTSCSQSRHLLGPFTPNITSKIIWPSWLQQQSTPRIQLQLNSGPVFVTVAPKQLLALKAFFNYWSIVEEIPEAKIIEKERRPSLGLKRKESVAITSNDDIRNGSFEFIHDWDGNEVCPKPGEVVFGKDQSDKIGIMTWRYHQPRVITKVDVYPVPLQSLDESSTAELISTEINCSLQYWDYLKKTFVNYQQFKLVESCSRSLELPHVAPDTVHLVACTDKWRVVLESADPDTEHLPVLPNVLAACMRVDSIFDPLYIPTFQASISIDLMQITFSNHFRNGSSPSMLYPFQLDGQSIQDQEFMVVTLDNSKFVYNQWKNKQKADLNLVLSCEILEYRNLTLQMFVEPVDIHCQILSTQHAKKRTIFETEINIQPCYLRLGQSGLHTLNITLQAWLQQPKEKPKQIIPNYYIICNNTQENIRFGQMNTEETILLLSSQMNSYSWRTHKAQQLLRVCLESMHWKWCEPFCMDQVGTKVRVLESNGQSVTLVIKIEKLNSIQKQIIITGQVLVSSRLDLPLDVRFTSPSTGSHWLECRLPQSPASLNPTSTLPGYLVHSSQAMAIQLRQQEVGAAWSESLPVMGNQAKEHLILEIPGNKSLKIWCHVFTEELLPYVTLYLVVLTPLYVLRNHLCIPVVAHIQSTKDEPAFLLEVAGKGFDTQLSVSESAVWDKQVLFQLASGTETSNPAVKLPQASELENHEEKDSIDTMCHDWLPLEPYCWPYDCSDREKEFQKLLRKNVLLHHNCVNTASNIEEAPNTVLNVSFYKPWSNINTVLIDIKPWALLVNRSSMDLFLQESSGQEWLLPKEGVLTPPAINIAFSLAVEFDGQLYFSDKLSVVENSDDDDQWKNCSIPLFNGKVARVEICIPKLKRICCLLVNVHLREKVYIITVHTAVYVTNNSSKTLQLTSWIISSATGPPKVLDSMQELTEASDKNEITPILLWQSLAVVPPNQNADYDYSLCLAISQENPNPTNTEWSLPINIPSLKHQDRRYTLSLIDGSNHSLPFVITCHWFMDVLFINIERDYSPLLCLHNYTGHTLWFGQGIEGSQQDQNIYEETFGIDFLPKLGPGTFTYYTLPSVNTAFPGTLDHLPGLHLACAHLGKEEESLTKLWCPAINVSEAVDHFVHITDVGDVRIHKELIGHTMHVFMESVNRVEVSAKEIRSRIGTTCKTRISSDFKTVPKQNSKDSPSSFDSIVPRIPVDIEMPKIQHHHIQSMYYISIVANHICGVICDDFTKSNESKELFRICLDRVGLFCRPTDVSPSRVSSYCISKEDIAFYIGILQIDNQLAHGIDSDKDYDFNVLLVPQARHSLAIMEDAQQDNYPSKCSEKAFVSVNLSLTRALSSHDQHGQVIIQKLVADIHPVAIYLEDSLYYQLLKIMETMEPTSLEYSVNVITDQYLVLPKAVSLMAHSFANPIPIVELEIKPLTVLVSLHASLKLYLAIDHSPLSFKSYHNQHLYTSSYKLGQLFTLHYLTGALLRAGWVVGSLDLLGNPAGLARAVSSGFSDMILLPYKGLLHSPWAFVTGMSHGTASFIRQISSGAVMSVTNLATSISRNMDRLSLDSEHLQRQKEMRHKIPQGIATGLLQGLSGFGLSLLGAIAGLVDQPLQAIISESVVSSTGASFVLKAATGIVGGAGKGIVGMVVKPIGGAAELISQTGHGLLQGVGWQNLPNPRYLPATLPATASINSYLKFLCKVLHNSMGNYVLLFLEATHVNNSGNHVADILVLTTQVLSIVNKEDDKQQQTFSLTEIDCCACANDSSVLYITIRPGTTSGKVFVEEVDKDTNDRVAEYLSQVSSELGHTLDQAEALRNPSVRWRDAYKFNVYSKLRDHFVSVFEIEQQKALGKRFPL